MSQEEVEGLYLMVFGDDWGESFPIDAPNTAEYVLCFLDEREQDVLRKRLSGVTLAKIGEEYGVTRETVRQIQIKALRKLRSPKNSVPLKIGLSAYSEKKRKEKEILEDRSIPKSERLSAITMEDMGLSARTFYALKRYGWMSKNENSMNTAGDVYNLLRSGKIVQVRGVGKSAIEEVVKKLCSYGVCAADDIYEHCALKNSCNAPQGVV